MKGLIQIDLLYLEAAKGWFLLGNLKEADAELDRIDALNRLHPDVLEMRFAIYARSGKWVVCLELAAALVGVAPDRASSWVYSAMVLHALKETHAAWHTLHEVMERFPEVSEIPYDLACYACALGRYAEGCEMLERAIKVGGSELASLARQDPDLKALWVKMEAEA